jgi:uncharacterized protein YggU (UPF0235/DUF167 family)
MTHTLLSASPEKFDDEMSVADGRTSDEFKCPNELRPVAAPAGWSGAFVNQPASWYTIQRSPACHGVPVASESRFIEVRVKLHCVASSLRQDASGAWVAELRSPPIDGKANAELIALVARHFDCRTAAVSIKRGGTGRKKLLKIESD